LKWQRKTPTNEITRKQKTQEQEPRGCKGKSKNEKGAQWPGVMVAEASRARDEVTKKENNHKAPREREC
jgi:hypothetical protein